MIALASDYLLFQMASGESEPFSLEMISVEIIGEAANGFDPEFVKHATGAVFHYFKDELRRQTVTVTEFAGALKKVLRKFPLSSLNPAAAKREPIVVESDLRKLAVESGKGSELFFFPLLRDELRAKLHQSPQLVRFSGLRTCVKQLAGAQRWSPRCRILENQIVEYLRGCLTAEDPHTRCALLVE
jgi:hypothetical protein